MSLLAGGESKSKVDHTHFNLGIGSAIKGLLGGRVEPQKQKSLPTSPSNVLCNPKIDLESPSRDLDRAISPPKVLNNGPSQRNDVNETMPFHPGVESFE